MAFNYMWIIAIIIIIIIILIVAFYFWNKFKPDPTPSPLDLTKLVNLDDLTPCPDTNNFFVESLNMIVSPVPNVASLVCLDALSEDDFNICESRIIPQENNVLAAPVAYLNGDNGVTLYYGLRLAKSC